MATTEWTDTKALNEHNMREFLGARNISDVEVFGYDEDNRIYSFRYKEGSDKSDDEVQEEITKQLKQYNQE